LGTGVITVRDAFARSSNVAFAKLADQYYHDQPEKFINHIHSLRLDTLSGVDITASSGFPVVKKPKSRTWSATTIPFMAHGYEVLETPLNMLMVYNAVANNGKMMKPYLVNSIREYGIDVKTYQPQVLIEKICSDETLAQLKACMLAVVDSAHGTAHKIMDSTYQIAGKTGTAVTALDNKGYNKGNKIYQASFIGFFPAEKPVYTIAVVIQNSSESKLIYGADVSGTVFKEISDKVYARYLGKGKSPANVSDTSQYNYSGLKNDLLSLYSSLSLPFADSANSGVWRSATMKNNSSVMRTTYSASSGTITPNVTGMGLKDAVYLLEEAGFKVTVSGRGKVVNQIPAAGTIFKKNQNISIVLN